MQKDPYQLFAESLRWLAQNYSRQPALAEIAEKSGLSEYHFQRQFKQWVGISPKRFVESLSVKHARQLLDQGESVLDASLDSGLSSPSRLHDLLIRHQALTPGEYKRGGAGLDIHYGVAASPFGDVLVAVCERGITSLVFVEPEATQLTIEQMRAKLPNATYTRDQSCAEVMIAKVFEPAFRGEIQLLLAGSPFQISIWQALLQVPANARVSYSQLARATGRPKAHRAVGTAVGANAIALLIPCHRVIRADTGLGGYRWGLERKLALQAWEHDGSLLAQTQSV